MGKKKITNERTLTMNVTTLNLGPKIDLQCTRYIILIISTCFSKRMKVDLFISSIFCYILSSVSLKMSVIRGKVIII